MSKWSVTVSDEPPVRPIGPAGTQSLAAMVRNESTRSSGTVTIGGDVVVNRMGFGAMRLTGPGIWGEPKDAAEARRVLRRAVELGVDFIDTADAYPVPPTPETAGRTEEIIGKWLRGKRDSYVLATKCRIRVGPGPNDEGLSRRHIVKACEDSLRRLGTDYIDLPVACNGSRYSHGGDAAGL